MRKFALGIIAVIALVFCGCDKTKNEIDNPTGQQFAMNEESIQMIVGATFQLEPVWTPEIDGEATYTYNASNNVATVDKDGLITAVKLGESNITVVAEYNGKKYIDTVQVIVEGLQLRINGEIAGNTPVELTWREKAVISLPVGISATWSAAERGADVSLEPNSTGNSCIVFAIPGCLNETPITITAECEGKAFTCQIVVKPVELTISIEGKTSTLLYKKSYTISTNYETEYSLPCTFDFSIKGILSIGGMNNTTKVRTLNVENYTPGNVEIVTKYTQDGKTMTSKPYIVYIDFPDFNLEEVKPLQVKGRDLTLGITIPSMDDNYVAEIYKSGLLKWSASNANVTFKNNTCGFQKLGAVTITATLGTNSHSTTINILPGFEVKSNPSGKKDYIYIYPSNVYYEKGSKTYGLFDYSEFWKMMGDDNKRIADSGYTGKIDLLAYGVSQVGGDPLLTTTVEWRYLNFTWYYPVTVQSTMVPPFYQINYDGEHDKIVIDRDMMQHIIYNRPNAAKKYSVCRIDLGSTANPRYCNGLLLIPDCYEWPTTADSTAFLPGAHSWDKATYTLAKMRQMVNNGAVFLPAGGNRRETGMNVSANAGGYYWLNRDDYKDYDSEGIKNFRGSILHFDYDEVEVYTGSAEKNNYSNRGLNIRVASRFY